MRSAAIRGVDMDVWTLALSDCLDGSQRGDHMRLLESRSRGFSMWLVLAILAMALVPYSRALAQDTPVAGGTYRTAISEEPDQLDPANTNQLLASSIMNNIYDALVYIDKDGLPKPWVAESWKISADNLTVTFVIRQGIKFHDGTDLDASAVKFSFDRILDPAAAAPNKAFLGSLSTVEAPDATTVVFKFKSPYAPFFTNLLSFGIVSPTAVKASGENFGHDPVGSGPFMFGSWDTGSKITLKKNPNYVNYREDDLNKGPAYIDEIVYNVISEASTQSAAFEAGELDMIGAPREDVARLAATDGISIVSLEKSSNINFIEFAANEPYNSEAFRKAVSYAIDRQAIADIAYLGNATPNQCPIPIANAAYDAELCAKYGYSYDLEKAKKALADGGFADGDGDGIVEFKGKNVTVTLWSYAPYPVQSKTIELVQADLNKIGLKVEVQTVEFGAMQPMLESGEIGFDYMRWTYSDQSILSALFKSPGWTGQQKDPALDKLIEVSDTTVDPVARIEASHKVMVYLLQHAVIAPVVSDWVQSAVRDNVHDYHWDALNTERLIDVWIAK
jgi:peptide/nickel transport system substrate-binding protein